MSIISYILSQSLRDLDILRREKSGSCWRSKRQWENRCPLSQRTSAADDQGQGVFKNDAHGCPWDQREAAETGKRASNGRWGGFELEQTNNQGRGLDRSHPKNSRSLETTHVLQHQVCPTLICVPLNRCSSGPKISQERRWSSYVAVRFTIVE